MAKVEIEFTLKNGEKLITSNKTVIDQLKATGIAYKEVGKSAEDANKKATDGANKQTEAIKTLKQQYKDAVTELNKYEQGTEAYTVAAERAGLLKDKLEENARAINANKSGADAFIGSLSGIAGGFAAAQGAAALFGGSSDELQKSLLKVQSALALAQGIEQLKDAKDAFTGLAGTVKDGVTALGKWIAGGSVAAAVETTQTAALGGQAVAQEAVTVATTSGTIALKLFRAALIATGIGAIVVLLGELAGAWSVLGINNSKANKEAKLSADIFKESRANAAVETVNLEILYKKTQDVTLSTEARTRAAIELQKTYPETFSNFTNEEILLGKSKDAYDGLVVSISNVALAKAKQGQIDKSATDFAEKEADLRIQIQKRENDVKESDDRDYFVGKGETRKNDREDALVALALKKKELANERAAFEKSIKDILNLNAEKNTKLSEQEKKAAEERISREAAAKLTYENRYSDEEAVISKLQALGKSSLAAEIDLDTKKLAELKKTNDAKSYAVVSAETNLNAKRISLQKENNDKYLNILAENNKNIIGAMKDGRAKELAQLQEQYRQDIINAKQNGYNLTNLKLKLKQDDLEVNQKYDKQINTVLTESLNAVADLNKNSYVKEIDALIKQSNDKLEIDKKLLESGNATKEQFDQLTADSDKVLNAKRLEIQKKYVFDAFKNLIEFRDLQLEVAFKSVTDQNDIQKQINYISEKSVKERIQYLTLELAEKEKNDKALFSSAFEADDKILTLKEKSRLDSGEITQKEFDDYVRILSFKTEFNKTLLFAQYEVTQEALRLQLEAQIKFDVKAKSIDSDRAKDGARLDSQYYDELKRNQEIFGTDYEKFNNYKILLDKEYAKTSLANDLYILTKKIELAESDPNFDKTKLSEMRSAKLKFETELAAADIDIQKTTNEQKLAAAKKYVDASNQILGEAGALIDDLYSLEIQKQTKHYDDLLTANEDYYNKLSDQNNEAMLTQINDYSLSQEEKANIQDEYALKEFAIRQKQNEETKKLEEQKATELKKLKKEQARIDMAIQIAQIISNTAVAVAASIAASPLTFGLPWSAVNAAAGAIQVAAAIAQNAQVQALAQGGLLTGASHDQGGIPIGNTGIEVEGGEAVINKRSTAKYAPLLSAINMAGGGKPLTPNFTGGMAAGGQMSFDQNSITQAIQNGMQNGQLSKAYILSSDVQSDIIKNNRIKRQASF